MTTAIVVGSGPNGLAAAVRLAEAGLDVTVLEADDRIGGGASSAELTVPGVIHDLGSGFHPLGVASPFFRDQDLARHGLRYVWPEVQVAHPLDDEPAGLIYRDVERTASRLGEDADAWRDLFGAFAGHTEHLADDALAALTTIPRHPLLLARFGLRAAQPAGLLARRWKTAAARGLWAGCAAHGTTPFSNPLSSAAGLLLAVAAHSHGWPVAQGGSQSVADALVSRLRELGGSVETGVRVTSVDDLPPHDVLMLDTAPGAAAQILGDRLPGRVRRTYTSWKHGPGSFKIDIAVEGGLPWTDPDVGRAGTVHLGGTFEEIAYAEREVAAGRLAERPYVLLGQQSVADPTRAAGDVHPVWAYAHVPNGWEGTREEGYELIMRQIERFAPGARDRVVGRSEHSPADLEAWNPNYVGGDIAAGATGPMQLAMRPRLTPQPWLTGVKGVYLCSAATLPGPGVHGMCGQNAAVTALRALKLPG
ncbi:NAD(P)/FAD-dependent oxidoreductase [Nocardioidaceae bacterium]|nr:NAD(P)/FAD-dependent oxidoreductase [Nocardioidaceae bacterium]